MPMHHPQVHCHAPNMGIGMGCEEYFFCIFEEVQTRLWLKSRMYQPCDHWLRTTVSHACTTYGSQLGRRRTTYGGSRLPLRKVKGSPSWRN
jgi:hypothetical protein